MTNLSPLGLDKPRILLIGVLPESLINFRGPLLRALVEAGCAVHAAAAFEKGSTVIDDLHDMGVVSHAIPIARTGMNPLKDIAVCKKLFNLMRSIKPEIVISYTIKPVIWGTFAARLVRVPRRYAMITGLGYAFTGEAKGKRGLVQKVARRLYRVALTQAHHVFFQNPDDLTLFRQLRLIPSDKPVSIVNGSGVDLGHYRQQPLPDGPPTFLMIARLLGDKGVREYAAAASLVSQRYPDAEFHLVGGLDPNPDSVSQAEVDQWVADGAIIWHGPQPDVRPFLAAAKIFVLPSYREGTPRTVLEAMAIGRPIITTNAPGCRETVRDGENGFLVPPRSTEALADAMLKFFDDTSLADRMAVKSLEIARDRYSSEKVSAAMLTAMEIPPRMDR